MIYNYTIIGAGASGLMAASFLQNIKVAIIDSNKKIGEKIKISGGSKCNITNKYLDSSHYDGDKERIDWVFSKFNNEKLLSFLNKHNLFPKIDEKIVKGTYFCKSSQDVINMFLKTTKKSDFYLENKVIDVEFKDNLFVVKTDKNIIYSEKLIVASGGLSYPSLGASDIGYKIGEKFGHTITKTTPSLVGFTVQKDQFWFKELSGLSIDAVTKVEDKKFEGKLLFTHKGCSGPVILNSSLYWKKGNISINFLPQKDSYLPKRLKKALKEKNLDLKNYSFSPAGNFGYTKAEVTRGGIVLDQLHNNFESKLQKGLYFVGEVVDVTGELGGYNFQWAFSSSYCAVT